eukprot:Pgem_evm1s19005
MDGYQIWAKLDLSKAFWQIPIKATDRYKTAFAVDNKLLQYTVCPMGLTTSPSTLCRIMQIILKDCIDICIPYMDDCLIQARTFEELIERCQKVILAFGNCGITLNGAKTEIGLKEVEFLGCKISKAGRKPLNKHTSAIQNWKNKKPKTRKDMQKFIGLTNYLSSYIPNYSTLASSLTKEMANNREKISWTTSLINEYNTLIDAMTSPDAVKHPDFSEKGGRFEIYTDSNKYAIAYASHMFTRTQRTWPNLIRETYAIHWSLTHAFHYYIYLTNKEIHVFTDHKPCLIFKSEKKMVNEKMYRMALAIQQYNYTLFYKKGSTLIDADLISRYEGYVLWDKDSAYQELENYQDEIQQLEEKTKIKINNINWFEIEKINNKYQTTVNFSNNEQQKLKLATANYG